MGDIDIVIPWVDGGDPDWLKEKESYSEIKGDKRNVRYREWDVLKYWFRGVEKYAPWVRKIHFITWGHLPEWLNTDNEKLHIVNHKDYIPKEYLPTFNANTIELNIHKIEGLSEKFVYFNDDFYFVNPTMEKDFFVNGLPCDIAGLHPGYATRSDVVFDHLLLNDAEFYVKHFDYKEVMKRDKKKWFKLSYGKELVKTLVMLLFSQFPDIAIHHQPQGFMKSTFEDVWKKELELLDSTCRNRFRTRNDVNQYVFRYWQIGNSQYHPVNLFKRGQSVQIGHSPLDYNKLILNTKYKILVLNDCGESVDFDEEKKNMQNAFELKFPEKCSFEK